MAIADFIKDTMNVVAFNYMADSVTYTPRTKLISSVSGQEYFTDGTASTITVNFKRQEKKWFFDKVGKIEGGDALMLVPYDSTVSEDDKITFLGNDYSIFSVLPVTSTGSMTVFKQCNMFLID
jgi:hypothetical protein